jgi:hypothetical protein
MSFFFLGSACGGIGTGRSVASNTSLEIQQRSHFGTYQLAKATINEVYILEEIPNTIRRRLV